MFLFLLISRHSLITFRDLLPLPQSKVQLVEGSPNNLPDVRASRAATNMADMASRLGKRDILLTLISGETLLVEFVGSSDMSQENSVCSGVCYFRMRTCTLGRFWWRRSTIWRVDPRANAISSVPIANSQ